VIGQDHCQMVCSQAVLEPGVICSGVDQICETELLYPAQPLHLWRAYQSSSKVVKLNIAVNWVSDLYHFVRARFRKDDLLEEIEK
jgi:hypothetical protein